MLKKSRDCQVRFSGSILEGKVLLVSSSEASRSAG